MDFEKLLLTESEHWRTFLHSNQHYLGRSYVWAKRDSVIDFLDITDDEMNDFFGISREIKQALKGLFHPDLFNYASLGNVSSHLHIHIIPRYQSPREFGGLTFSDDRWGKNYAPYNYDFQIPEETMIKIRDAIRGKLK